MLGRPTDSYRPDSYVIYIALNVTPFTDSVFFKSVMLLLSVWTAVRLAEYMFVRFGDENQYKSQTARLAY